MAYRIFIINSDNSIDTISQKSFSDFYLRHEPTLTRYAGQEIHIASVYYTLKDKRPDQIIRIESLRIAVENDGSIDLNRKFDSQRLALNLIGSALERTTNKPAETVIDAKAKFDERRRAQYNPEISALAIKHILQKLFRHES